VNGKQVDHRGNELKTGSRVILGRYHVFRFQHPSQAREHRASRSPCGENIPETPHLVDWSFAQIELLEKQGIDLKLEMEKKLLAMEEQYKKEKEQADLKFQEQKKNYEERIESLQKQVDEQSMAMSAMYASNITGVSDKEDYQEDVFADDCVLTQQQYKCAKWAAKKWKFHQFTSLRDDLWGNAIFLKEANAISVELKKRVQFQFVLLTDTIYSPLPKEMLKNNDESTENEHDRPFAHSVVAVEVTDIKNGATHYWSLNKLR